MDEAAIKALVESLLNDKLSPVTQKLEGLEGLSAQLTQITDLVTKPSKEPEKPKEEDGAKTTLKSRIDALEAELAKRDQLAQESRFKETLGKQLNEFNPMFRSVAEELLGNRLKGFKEVEGVYLDANGRKLEEAVKDFFSSPEGKHLLPANVTEGTGSKETVEKKGSGESLEASVSSAFGF